VPAGPSPRATVDGLVWFGLVRKGGLLANRVMTSKPPISCLMVVESKLSAGEGVCHGIMSILKKNGFANEDLFAVHLALEEAFINAVRHGNKMDPTKEVRIECAVGPEKIEISVSDEGNGFDPGSVPDPRCGQNLYKPHGRGLLLIRSYMDQIEHNERGNTLRMVRYRERPPVTEDMGQATL